MNKITRALLGGLLVALFYALFGNATCGGAFKSIYLVQPWMWKDFACLDSKFWTMLSLSNFVIGFIFTLIFMWIYKGLPGRNSLQKGVYFGLIIWILGTLPGMISTHMFSNMFPIVVSYTTLTTLIRLLSTGVIVSLVYKE